MKWIEWNWKHGINLLPWQAGEDAVVLVEDVYAAPPSVEHARVANILHDMPCTALVTIESAESLARLANHLRVTGTAPPPWFVPALRVRTQADLAGVKHLTSVKAARRWALLVELTSEEIDLDPPTCPDCDGFDGVPGSDHVTLFCRECETEMAYGAILDACAGPEQPGVGWVIARGHSEPVHYSWARRVRDDASKAGVAFAFTSWGAWIPAAHMTATMHEGLTDKAHVFPNSYVPPLVVRPERYVYSHAARGKGAELCYRVGTDRSGRMIDGKVHDQTPLDIDHDEEPAKMHGEMFRWD